MNKEMVFLILCCIGIWLLGAFFVVCLISGETMIPASIVVTTTPEGGKACIDSDVNQAPNDIYIKGHVVLIDKSGVETRGEDYCSGSGLSVNEMRCVKNSNDNGDYYYGNTVYKCTRGCFNGACR